MSSCDYPGAPEPEQPDGGARAGSRGVDPIGRCSARERESGGEATPPPPLAPYPCDCFEALEQDIWAPPTAAELERVKPKPGELFAWTRPRDFDEPPAHGHRRGRELERLPIDGEDFEH